MRSSQWPKAYQICTTVIREIAVDSLPPCSELLGILTLCFKSIGKRTDRRKRRRPPRLRTWGPQAGLPWKFLMFLNDPDRRLTSPYINYTLFACIPTAIIGKSRSSEYSVVQAACMINVPHAGKEVLQTILHIICSSGMIGEGYIFHVSSLDWGKQGNSEKRTIIVRRHELWGYDVLSPLPAY